MQTIVLPHLVQHAEAEGDDESQLWTTTPSQSDTEEGPNQGVLSEVHQFGGIDDNHLPGEPAQDTTQKPRRHGADQGQCAEDHGPSYEDDDGEESTQTQGSSKDPLANQETCLATLLAHRSGKTNPFHQDGDHIETRTVTQTQHGPYTQGQD